MGKRLKKETYLLFELVYIVFLYLVLTTDALIELLKAIIEAFFHVI